MEEEPRKVRIFRRYSGMLATHGAGRPCFLFWMAFFSLSLSPVSCLSLIGWLRDGFWRTCVLTGLPRRGESNFVRETKSGGGVGSVILSLHRP